MQKLRSITGGRGTPEAGASLEELYAELAAASTRATFVAAYLEIQSRVVPGLRRALLVLGPPDRGPFEVAGVWPEGDTSPQPLLEGAQQAIIRRSAVLTELEEEELEPAGQEESQEPERQEVAEAEVAAEEGVEEATEEGVIEEGEVETQEMQASQQAAEPELAGQADDEPGAGGSPATARLSLAPPELEPADEEPPVAATASAVLAQPLFVAVKLHGALVVEVDSKPEPELRQLLQQLRLGTGWPAAHLQRLGGREGLSRKARLELVPNLLAATVDQERFPGASRAFATELATELGCDRVAVGAYDRGRVTLQALSHASHAGKRTNLVQAIEGAMDEAVDQRATIVYPAAGEATVGTQAHAELARQHGSQAICTVPLVQVGRICGAITLERAEGPRFNEETVRLCEAAASLVGPVLEVMRLDDRWIGRKLADVVRTRLRQLIGPNYVALKLATGGVAALLLFLALANGDYRVTADTVLEPVVLRVAAAPFDGYVATAPARAGDLVEEGDLLAALDDRDLRLEQVKWSSQREQLMKQQRQALADRDAARVKIFTASLDEAEAELARIEDRLSRSELRAPFAGIVISGDLTEQLGAPVEKGAVLFEVAPLDAYRVTLEVPETDIADVEIGQSGRIVFASLPQDVYAFKVERITPVAVAEEGSNYFLVEAQLAEADARLRPAIEGVAKIDAGRRRLLWIWTHEAVNWLRLALWKWLP